MKTRALVLFFVATLGLHHGFARPIVGITSTNQLVSFDSATPGTISSTVAITGLVAGDQIHEIDFRPANGILYALGVNNTAGNNTGRIYTIDTTTVPAVATVVGATPFSTNLADGADYAFDFIPTVDRIRVINTGRDNLRVNPDTGGLSGADTLITAGSTIVGAAHDRSDRNPATLTTLFGINSATSSLVRIGGVDGTPSPNGGVVTTIGALGVTISNVNVGFDIAEDGVAFASLPTIIAGTTTYRLYTVNLATGTATAVANIGTGLTPIRGIAAVPTPVANIDSGEFFATIQAAINDAQTLNGHTIVVNAGTFSEFVTVNKSVTLLGAKSGI